MPITKKARREVKIRDWRPWAYAGERVWVQEGSVWVEADPQPDVNEWGVLAGSVCDRRSHHDMDIPDPDNRWDVCLDCGYVEPPYEPKHL